MCGITGFWAYSSRDLEEPAFAAFTHSLAHRGPDGFGIEHFREPRLWLGHRRLAIIDLSPGGRQPMSYAEGRYWLTYNGEIYNYLELREELRGLGHRFVSDSDSEVILAAYAQWGPDCQLRFNGMWAFAIWDAQQYSLFLSRDRFGVKPLHYCDHAGAFVFASELKAFLALSWIDGSLDQAILKETLTNIGGIEGSPYTLLPGVRRLPAGHAMLITAGGKKEITVWWDTLDHLPCPPPSLDEQAEQFRTLFFEACRLRLRSDVPVATSLSGGLDSSAIACTLAELNRRGQVEHAPKDWHRAFVACFIGTPYNERQYATAVVKHAGMLPCYLDVDDHIAVKNIEKIIFDSEGLHWFVPVGAWALYQAIRFAGISVSLDGQGSDELMGGYHAFVERAIEAAIGSLDPRRYFDLRGVLTGLVGGTETSKYAGRLGAFRLLARGLLAGLEQANGRGANFRSHLVRLVRGLTLRQRSGETHIPQYDGPRRLYYDAADARVAGMSPLQALLFTWFHGSFLPTLLGNVDRLSMSHGIEVRVPFMDWRLVTFCFALPESSKIGGGFTKRVLREAMRGILPEPIRLRTKKIGYVAPMDSWARGALKPWLLDLCASKSFLESSVWSGPMVRVAVEQAVDGNASIGPLWPIVNAHVLEQSFKQRAYGVSRSLQAERASIN